MKATLITIGDELLIGQVINTNAAWLGERLGLLGVDLVRMATVGDDEAAIREDLTRALDATDLVILTGGLGPTPDDITVETVARHFGLPLRRDEATLEQLRERFRRRGREVPVGSERMAIVPAGAEVLSNPVGAAPGLWYVAGEGAGERVVVVLPGVPREMKALFEEAVVPRLRRRADLRVIVHRTLLTAGVGESDLQAKIGDLSGYVGPSVRLAYLPGTGGVRLRLTALGDDAAAVAGLLDRLEARLRARIASYIYGRDTDTLEAVVGRLLAERGLTVAVAESCTGGLVLHRLTNTPGSSAYVEGGVVAYANAVKVEALGVEAVALAREGAVSETVALQMARGVRERLGAGVGLATTGVAGPTGGTPEKPVGTVWIAYADARGETARLLRLVQDRELNKELSATAVLELARRRLLDLSQEEAPAPDKKHDGVAPAQGP